MSVLPYKRLNQLPKVWRVACKPMPIYGIVINEEGKVVSHRLAPHQADDCDGLIYKATDKDGIDHFLFLIEADDERTAISYARDTFDAGEFAALDPIWQPGSIWPDKPDEERTDKATVMIVDERQKPYITTVQTHGRVNPFIEHFGERITWAYMRLIERRCIDELSRENERWRRYWEERHTQQPSEVPIVREAVAEPTRQAKQLSFDFG